MIKDYEEFKEGKLELYDWKDIHKGLRDKYTYKCVTRKEQKMMWNWPLRGMKNEGEGRDFSFWIVSIFPLRRSQQ